MAVGKRYLLDANVFIQAHQQYYGFDICPGFWDALCHQHRTGRIFSIDWVKKELVRPKSQAQEEEDAVEDILREWIRKNLPSSFFKGTRDKNTLKAYKDIMTWVQDGARFTPAEKAKFAQGADGWLIAYAKASDMLVVTHEAEVPPESSRVKIPNVCRAFHVEYCDTFNMLRDLDEQFVPKRR